MTPQTPPPPPRMPHTRYRTREGRWEARLQVSGLRIIAYGRTERDATEAWLAAWFARFAEPSQDLPKSQIGFDAPATVGELLDRWLSEHVALHLAARTRDTYEGITRLHLRPAFGDIPLRDLKAAHVQRYINGMVADDAPTTTIARHKTTLQSAIHWAVRPMGWLDAVPMASVSSPRPRPGVTASNARSRSPEVDIPNADDVIQLLDATRGTPLWAMWFAGHSLGLRASELVALTEESLILGPSGRVELIAIHQKAFRSRDPGRPWVVEEPKRASYRELEAPRSTIDVLLNQARAMRAEQAAHARWPARWDRWLFLTAKGEPYDPTNLPPLFANACRLAGVPVRTPHSVRHYCASQLLEAGVSVKRVSAWMGHRTTQMVENTYGHLLKRTRGQEPTGAVFDRILGRLASTLASGGN